MTCTSPTTLYERLKTDFIFKAICKKNQNGGKKEILLLREQTKENPRAAVTPNFPCCLLNNNELLDIQFISADGNSSAGRTQKLTVRSPEDWVSFYIKTRGEQNIRKMINNKELKGIVDHVCVYAVKGEKVRAALKRDGRFHKVTLSKGALYEQETENTLNLSCLVDSMDGKQFQVIRQDARYQTGSQESSQEMSQEMSQEFETTKNEKQEVPEAPQATNTNRDSISTQDMKTEGKEKKSRKYPDTQKIPNTQEILELLREQHGDLLKRLRERENLKNNVEVKKFFREEYDKSAQSFTEVKRVKKLMKLSDSICQIRSDGFAKGTGFLLFNRFVLTNAHVVGDLVPLKQITKQKLTAVFEFEDLNSGREMPLKENVVAFLKDKDDMGNHLDFALLELNCDLKLDVPELLMWYSTPPIRGGVCIIGHPEGGVKRMDPCFIIPKGGREEAAVRYYEINKNLEVYHVITQDCLAEDKVKRESQILYSSCFFHGSSGSPVFDDLCNLIGVHTGGYVYEGKGKKTRSVMEYALPIFPILVHIYMQSHQSGRSDILQYLKSQNNMKYVLQVAIEQLQGNQTAI